MTGSPTVGFAAAIVPSTPLLLPGLTGRLAPEAELRRAALGVVDSLIHSGCERVVVAGSAPDGRGVAALDAGLGVSRFGGRETARQGRVLPTSLAVGRSLLAQAGWDGPIDLLVAPSPEDGERDWKQAGLLVVGSGSARATDKAPGGFSPDAAEFNAALLAGVRAGSPETIAAMSPARFAAQMSDLYEPVRLLAAACAGSPLRSSIAFADAPFGVYYICASFLATSGRRDSSSA